MSKKFQPTLGEVTEYFAKTKGAQIEENHGTNLLTIWAKRKEYKAFLLPWAPYRLSEIGWDSNNPQLELPFSEVKVWGITTYPYAQEIPLFNTYLIPETIRVNSLEEKGFPKITPPRKILEHNPKSKVDVYKDHPLFFSIDLREFEGTDFYKILGAAVDALVVIDGELKKAYEFSLDKIRRDNFNMDPDFKSLNADR